MSDDMQTDPNTVRITIKDVYALLLTVAQKVDATAGHGTALEDHEKRLRAVERNLWVIIGVGIVAQIVVPMILLRIINP